MWSNGATSANTRTPGFAPAGTAIAPNVKAPPAPRGLEQRTAELLPTDHFHVVFTLPEEIASIAFYNQEVVYDILFRTVAETLLSITGDPQRLGVETGFFTVLH